MVFFIRSFISDFDGKIQKYFSALKSADIQYHYIGWLRGDAEKIDNKNETFYKRKAPLGGGIKNIYNLLLWNYFIFITLIKNRKLVSVVHAIDFDSACGAFLFSRLFKKKFVFDVYDKYTDSRKLPNILMRFADSLEIKIIKKSDLAIIADESRYIQHGLSKNDLNVVVLENVPSTNRISYTPIKINMHKISLGYFGVLTPITRGLEDLVTALKDYPNITLHIVGYGSLVDFMKVSSGNNENIKFYGPKPAEEGLRIMQNMDILVGMYYRTVKNHLFAAPNKYYEHLMLGRPLLTTQGIPPGIKVEEYNTGWAIEEGVDSIKKWLASLISNNEEICLKSENAYRLWHSKYENYYRNYYEGFYIEQIKKFIE